jgi:viroplasmin and RNaseH domain-containing protein
MCGGTFRDSETQVDHIGRAGSFKEWDDCKDYLMGLMQVDFASLQILCKPCHDAKSYSENNNCTLEEAYARKSYIKWKNETPICTQQELLAGEGYNDVSNEKKRKAAYLDLYRNAT